jgi:HK97 family phage portal protein
MLLEALGFRAAAEASVDRGPLSDFWYMPVGEGGLNGVSKDAVMRIATAYACVRILCLLASCKKTLYRKTEDGKGKTEALDHPLYDVLCRQPNPRQTAMEHAELGQVYLALRGQFPNEIISDSRGRVLALEPLPVDRTRVELLTNGRLRYQVQRPNGTTDILTQDRVFNVKGLSLDGVKPMSVVDYHRQTFGISLAMDTRTQAFYKNGARPGLVVEGAKFANAAERKSFGQQIDDTYGGANQGRTAVMEFGMTLKPVALSQSDAQFIETYSLTDKHICAIFGVPPHAVAILERATNNNIEEQGIDLVRHCLRPWARRWEESIDRDLLQDPEYFVQFDLDPLLQGNSVNQSIVRRSDRMSGIITGNEGRHQLNLNPIDGLDEVLDPTPGAIGSQSSRDPGTEPTPGSGTGSSKAAVEHEAQLADLELDLESPAAVVEAPTPAVIAGGVALRLATDLARKLLHREKTAASTAVKRHHRSPDRLASELARAYDKHAADLAAELHCSPAAASAYCDAQRGLVLAQGLTVVNTWGDAHIARLAQLALEPTP